MAAARRPNPALLCRIFAILWRENTLVPPVLARHLHRAVAAQPPPGERIGGRPLVAGIVLGVLIGITSGVVFLLLLGTASRWKGASSIVPLTGEILAIPTFWFGGPWVSTKLLVGVSTADMLNPYLLSLLLTFSAIFAYPGVQWIVRLGKDLGAHQEGG
ncbi:MAG TPA: hypothetical protein VEK37_03450 [Gemmatimonadaceae bacterium]|nr:hypothetical protein [Gemmatimonadaceae bacterium]